MYTRKIRIYANSHDKQFIDIFVSFIFIFILDPTCGIPVKKTFIKLNTLILKPSNSVFNFSGNVMNKIKISMKICDSIQYVTFNMIFFFNNLYNVNIKSAKY